MLFRSVGGGEVYERDPDFATTYQMLGANAVVDNRSEERRVGKECRLLCRLGNLYISSSERAKLIWEAHYSRVVGHFVIEKTVAMLQKHFYWLKL